MLGSRKRSTVPGIKGGIILVYSTPCSTVTTHVTVTGFLFYSEMGVGWHLFLKIFNRWRSFYAICKGSARDGNG